MPRPPATPPASPSARGGVARGRLVAVGLALVLAAGCSGPDPSTSPPGSVTVASDAVCTREAVGSALAMDPAAAPEALAEVPVASALEALPLTGRMAGLLATADLVATLDRAVAVTMFVPTDCAIAAAPEAALARAAADPSERLLALIGHHVVPGERLALADLASGSATTFVGDRLAFADTGDTVVLDGTVHVLVGDLQVGNATIHLVDGVLWPDGVETADGSAPPAAGGPATVPAGQACSAQELVAAIQSGRDAGTLAGMADDPVAAAASRNAVLTTFTEAVVGAGMVDTLNAGEELTVFAPTDCAFAAVDEATIGALMADPSGRLAQLLGFHVVAGRRLNADQLAGSGELPTVAGLPLPYDGTSGVVTVAGQARVVVPDIQTANATVHLIDAVVMPPR